jgi:hypothetical protein
VSEVRFADAEDGWVWATDSIGEDLWSTHDGGSLWERPQLPGVPPGGSVSDLEAARGMVHATFNGPPGEIASSPVQEDDWQLSPTTLTVGAGPFPSEQIVLQESVGWIVEVDRTAGGGARLYDGGWVPWSPPCLQAGGPLMLAASGPADLVAVCQIGLWTGRAQLVRSYFSDDGGSRFQASVTSLPSSSFGPIASPALDTVVMGESDGNLIATFDRGATWTVVYHDSPTAGAWKYLGFTTSSQGVAIDGIGTLFITFNGGHDWAPVNLPPVEQQSAVIVP